MYFRSILLKFFARFLFISMDCKVWLVVKTNPRAEKMVAKRLDELGIENYLPIKRELKQWKDRKKWVDEVLLKSYVFVHTPVKLRHKVFDAFGVVRFLFFAGKIAVVTEKEIDVLRIFCKEKDIKISKKGFETGDEVMVIDGPLIGLTGRLKADASGGKISIYIAQLGLFASIKIDISAVKKL